MRTTSLPHRPARPRRALLAVLAVASVALASCGDDDTTTAPTTAPTTEADDGGTTSTTQGTTTTEASTTTTEAPSDEDQVRELVMGYATYHQRLGNPNDPNNPVIREMFTGPMLARVIDVVTGNAVEGSYYEGGYELEILGVSIDGDAGVVRTCGHDQITKRAADGSVVLPPEPEAYEIDFTVQRTDAGWRIAESTRFEEETCSLA